MNKLTKKSISLLGYIFSYGFLMLTVYTFWRAYCSPHKMVLVSVNSFGEQFIDVGCSVFAVAVASLGLHFAMKEYKQFKKEFKKDVI